MTHIEFLENLIAEYRAEFDADPSDDPEVSDFRAGMLFAWKLAEAYRAAEVSDFRDGMLFACRLAIERLKHPDDAVL